MMKELMCMTLFAGILLGAAAAENLVAYPAKALPVEKFAAEELAGYLTKSTGEKYRSVAENQPEAAQAAFFVGKCDALKAKPFYTGDLASEEFIVTAENGKIYIYGDDGPGAPMSSKNRAGTLLGVYDFLENELGIAWLWPGDDGEDVPSRQWLPPKDFSRRAKPVYSIRSMGFSYGKYEPKEINSEIGKWARRQKLGWTEQAWFGHSWHSYVFKTGVDKQHPEWLALYGGERRGPHCCTSNPDFRNYIVDQVLNHPTNKNMKIASVSPSDGYGFCECENCRKLDQPGTDYTRSVPSLSDRHWAYANYIAREVKKRNPDRGVGMFAYTAYGEAPETIDTFEDNLYLSMTFSKAYFVKPDIKEKFFQRLDKWKTKKVKIIGREYWGMHYWLSLPYIFTAQIAESMPKLYHAGLVGMYGEAQKDFATQGPNYFLVAHLLWNPEADSQRILDRYYQGFGPAAKSIRRYFDTFEQAILNNQEAIPDFSYRKLIYSWPEVLDPATLEKAGEALAAARKDTADQDTIWRKRVEFIGIGYDYTRIMMELLTTYRRLGQAGVPLTAFSQAGDQIEADKYKLPALPSDIVALWTTRPEKPLEKAEKIALLKRAIELGEARAKILRDNANLPAVSLGMYQYTIDKGIRPWHQTCIDELAKLNQ